MIAIIRSRLRTIDGVLLNSGQHEQPGVRPSNNQAQKSIFQVTGKKKEHTFKNQFVILPEGKDIVDVEVGEKGPNSDIRLFREQQ
jgi:hypothetical protein